MDLFQAGALGFIQGATEFLPVSSSGHLVLMGELLGVTPESNLAFGIFLHLATALAVIIYFWRRFSGLVRVFFANPLRKLRRAEIPNDDRRLGRLLVGIIIGTLPAVAIGLLLKDKIDAAFQSPELASWMLFVTAAILFSLKLFRRKSEPGETSSPPDGAADNSPAPVWWKALLIGLAQALAILPGISRSGSTIAAGIHLKEDQKQVAEFSFLLSLPAILGANILEIGDVISSGDWLPWPVYLVGGLVAFGTAFLAIKIVMKTVSTGRFWLFGIWCIIAGVAGLMMVG